MNNCLVTKLKGNVDNDNLLRASELAFNVTGNALFAFSGTVDMRIDGDGYFSETDGGQPIPTPKHFSGTYSNKNLFIVVTSGTVKLFVKDDYSITTIDTDGPIIGDFTPIAHYRNLDLSFNIRSGSANINKNGCLSNVKFAILDSPDIVCDLSAFNGNTRIERLTNYSRGAAFTGDIANLSGAVSMIKLNLYSPSSKSNYYGDIIAFSDNLVCDDFNVGVSNCSGTIESLVESWVSKGRTVAAGIGTSGTLITFNNVVSINGIRCEFSNGTATVKNGSGTVLGTYDGSTWTYV